MKYLKSMRLWTVDPSGVEFDEKIVMRKAKLVKNYADRPGKGLSAFFDAKLFH